MTDARAGVMIGRMSKRKRKRHPGYLQPRGDTFRLHLCVGGVRHCFTIDTKDRAIAERFAIDRARELERQVMRRRGGLPGVVSCSALFDLFERDELPARAKGTRDAYRDSLRPIRTYFVQQLGNPTIDRIHAKHIAQFLAWRRGTRAASSAPLTNRTLAKDRAVLHRIFAMAEQLEYRDGNPVSRVAAPKADGRDPVILSDEEYERLLAKCAERPTLALYMLTLGEAGLRCESEALQLRWEDVNLQDGFLWVSSGREGHRTKSGKGRWVPMTPRLCAAMREHFAACRFASYDGTRPVWVFHHAVTRRRYRAGDRIKSMRDAFERLIVDAKLPEGLRQHDLRHRRVTTWLAEGKAAALVQEAMGHSDIRVTLGYSHLAREHLRALVDVEPVAGPKNDGVASA
ncbi:MAG: tyrosine-type recombinase/integrase [Gemmatimonadaceae bacterium]